ncbi:unnamed protein product [Psylliodes chrysocephalus]|uniref:Uncharacterized protein n=1 Tax=Psylliodes chrysocephalus TaxID=3402493 RepID=A0A9P0CU81_9CUCU|nr:unnamed protein product [Psylliodes chrysocephala]
MKYNYLGVVIDMKLGFKEHCNHLVRLLFAKLIILVDAVDISVSGISIVEAEVYRSADDIDVVPVQISQVDIELTNLLGKKPDGESASCLDLHDEIVCRWNSYLKKGVSSEEKTRNIDKYVIAANCPALKFSV